MRAGYQKSLATVAGLVACVLWGTLVVGSRVLCESDGETEAAALIYGLAAVIGGAQILLTRHLGRRGTKNSWKYLGGCGTLGVFYNVFFFTTVGLAPSKQHLCCSKHPELSVATAQSDIGRAHG